MAIRRHQNEGCAAWREATCLSSTPDLKGLISTGPPALYIIGYFEVELAGLAGAFSPDQLRDEFVANFHVRHRSLFEQQKHALILVKGGKGSRLLKKAHLLSETITLAGKAPLKKITPVMRKVFGEFGGRHSFQRSPTRWVEPEFVQTAASFIRSLE